MILDNKQTTVAYRCPHCGTGVMSAVNLFSLSADMVKLKCTCGQSEMTAVTTKDKKVRLTVPCMLCPSPHVFTVTSSVFFKDELFLLPCPYSDINVCMIGEANKVKAELARSELALLDLLERSGLQSFDELHGKQEELTDPQIVEIILYVIRDLDEEGKIHCRCEEKEEGDYEVSFVPEGLRLTCKRCGASKTIPTNSLMEAHDFLHVDHLTLE